MGITEITDHAGDALTRVTEAMKDRPNFAALLNAINAQNQDLENAFWQLATERTIDAGVGAQLDLIGEIVGLARESAVDDRYRLLLKAKVKVNRSSGTIPELLVILALIFDLPAAFLSLRPEYPAGFTVVASGAAISSDAAAVATRFLHLAKVAGVRVLFEWAETDADNTFTYADAIPRTVTVANASGGDASLHVSDTVDFPDTGTIVVGRGQVTEETVSYTSKDSAHFFGFLLANAHTSPTRVDLSSVAGSTDEGYGTVSDPDVGGFYAFVSEG